MIAGLGRRELAILSLALSAAVAGSIVTLAGRGSESSFIYRQEHPLRLQPADVERAVQTAPDPLVGARGSRGTAARCRPHGSAGLRNPWTCKVGYRRPGCRPRLRVVVRDDGSYVGRYAGGGGIQGCCIRLPGVR